MRLKRIYISIAMIAAGLAVQAVLALPAAATTYETHGIATSTNLLSGSSASSINSFHYNIATLPATSSVTIQFSNDNSNWYSAAAVLNGSTTLSTIGGADLSLSALVWSGTEFYYKITLNSTSDQLATPTIDDIRLDYTPTSGYENVFVFDNFGNVGIGTTSPSGKLDIHGAGTTTGVNTQWSDLTGAAKVTILDKGYVGIGTTAPTDLLDIAGGVKIGAGYAGIGTTAPANGLLVQGSVGIGTTLPSQLFQVNDSGSTAFVVTSGGNVGIGNTSPGAKLVINSNTVVPAVVGTDTVLQLVGGAAANSRIENNAFGGYAAFLGRRADGTSASPTAVQANEIISRLDARGYGATGYSSAPRAMIDLIAGENWTDAAQGGYLSFSTTLNGGTVTSEKVRIDNSGNVGIGTTSPIARLHVRETSGVTPSLYLPGNTRDLAVGQDEILQIGEWDGTTWTTNMVINNLGNVGIGTTGPNEKLAVLGNIILGGDTGAGATGPGTYTIRAADAISNGSVQATAADLTIRAGNVSQSEFANGVAGNLILKAGIRNVGGPSGTRGVIQFHTGGTSVSEVMRIDGYGNVGIGTTNPGKLLDVSSDATTNVPTIRITDTKVYAGGSANVGDIGGALEFYSKEDSSGWPSVAGAIKSVIDGVWGEQRGLAFYTNSVSANPSEKLRITSTGNVGIGTTSPNQKLEVNGRIRMNTWTADGNTAVYYNSATGDIGVNVSDVRLKKNIQTIPNPLSIIQGITGVTYNMKTDPNGAQKTVGVIAQDVAAAMPELTFPITGPDGEEYLSVHYDKLAPVLIEGIKQQQTQIADVNLKTSQNVETVGQLQKSVDDNLVVISGNFSAVDTKLAVQNSQMAVVNSQIAGLGAEVSAINTRLTSLDTQTSAIVSQVSDLSGNMSLNEAEKGDLTSRLAAAEASLVENQHDLITFEKGTNNTLSAMLVTEDMLTSRVLDHEDRIKALEAKLATATVSATVVASGEIPANAVTQDALGNATLSGIFTAKGIVAGSVDTKNLKLGAQTSGSAKIIAGQVEIVIPSTEAQSGSKIYITPTGSTEEKILYVKKEDTVPGESFKVKFDGDPAAADIPFNWLIVN